MRIILLFSLLLFSSGESHAEDFRSGSYYLPMCKRALNNSGSGDFLSGVCVGAFNVLREIGPGMNSRFKFCPPEGVSTRQTIMVYVKFLEQHPERLHESYIVLAFDSLREAFPCK